MTMEQQPKLDAKDVFSNAMTQMYKSLTIATEMFQTAYAEALRLQEENLKLKEEISKK
jgi:hypothetical protein